MQAYAILFANFLRIAQRLAVLLVVGLSADHPQIRFHGLFAIGGVLLCEESRLVLGDVREVFLTLEDHRCDCTEAVADVDFFGRHRSAAFVAVRIERVQTLAVRVSRCCRTVRRHQIITVIVTVLFLRSFQCALDILYTRRAYFRFCHSLLAMTRTTARSALV